jgi:hypothetical protein
MISLISLFIFFYFTLLNIFKDKALTSFLALSILLSPCYFAQAHWPLTILPANLLLLSSVFVSKRLHYSIVFPLFSILFFGTLSQYIYFLPLLYINTNTDSAQFKPTVYYIKILVYWIITFIAGFISVNIITYLKFGNFIKLDTWRRPHYAHNIIDLRFVST